jgi:succinylglutamate desuccinylase
MPEVYSKALDKSIEVDRIIGQVISEERGPCMIFTGGIHGNEPSGIFALQQVLTEIKEKNIPVKGSIHAISGNLWALQRGERFHEKDLNRLWIGPRMRQLENDKFDPVNEDEREQKEIYKVLQDVMESNKGPYYFMDLHTTSSQTIPFLTVNDSLLNRKFTKQYPVPIILGIEEYLDGPLLSYINKLGYVAFGYEGGPT